MKRVLLSFTLMILLSTACAPQAQATGLPSDVEEAATHISTDLTPAQRIAISKLAENLGITPAEIKLVSTEAVDWPDSCLGIATEGIACAQVVTPGFRVILDANGKQVEYHTNQDATMIVPATVALIWKRSGGVAGFCDNMTIYLSGEVQASTCKNTEPVEKKLADLLTAEEIATMNDWISKYGTAEINTSDPANVADAMSVTLKLMGTGTEKITSPQVQQVLMQFVQGINQKLINP
jgi:hypothetical protein